MAVLVFVVAGLPAGVVVAAVPEAASVQQGQQDSYEDIMGNAGVEPQSLGCGFSEE